jgi:hypothetical protein
MSPYRPLGRLLCTASVALASLAACAGAAPAGGAPAVGAARAWTSTPDADQAARRDQAESATPDAGAAADSTPPPPSTPVPPPDDAPSADPPRVEPPADAGAAPPPLPTVEIGAPRFENGEVTKVEKSLGKASADLARCIADHGGLSGDTGTVKIQFLVRSRGRAEGVEDLAAKGVRAEASACVRRLVKNKAIGAPTADPVGVTVTLTFRAAR